MTVVSLVIDPLFSLEEGRRRRARAPTLSGLCLFPLSDFPLSDFPLRLSAIMSDDDDVFTSALYDRLPTSTDPILAPMNLPVLDPMLLGECALCR